MDGHWTLIRSRVESFSSGENIFTFGKLLKNGDTSSLPPFKAEPEEMFEMLYTGGTTGVPKGSSFFKHSLSGERG